MNVVAGVKKATSGDCDVFHLVPIEGELELKVDGGCPPVALRQHGVLLYHSLEPAADVHRVQVPVELAEVILRLELLLVIFVCVVRRRHPFT